MGKSLTGGHAALTGLINCVVHVIMYFYYYLTIVNPEYKKSIWWKKHITQIQMVILFNFIIIKIKFKIETLINFLNYILGTIWIDCDSLVHIPSSTKLCISKVARNFRIAPKFLHVLFVLQVLYENLCFTSKFEKK